MRNSYFYTKKSFFFIIINSYIALSIFPFILLAAVEPGTNQLLSFSEKQSGTNTEINITGQLPVISTIYTLPNPDRIIVDIAETGFSTNFKEQLATSKIANISVDSITDAKPFITRLQILPKFSFEFTHKNSDNFLQINITEKFNNYNNNKNASSDTKSSLNSNKINDIITNNDGSSTTKIQEIQKQLPLVNPLDKTISKQASVEQMHDAFNFSGYNKERITVEFQKMDLHNVFNFLRQVSGVNIVVDESVQGSLTLVLDDVPWDFALDIILNLKNLEKEDRFNTLVIYPKGKGFVWPKQADQNLSFEANTQVVEQQSLTIRQLESQSIEITEAKQQMSLAKEAEKREEYETAVKLYEQAFEKWHQNSLLANKISSIYLVHLRQNAKALYFANKSIVLDPNNTTSYLNAGIASSNMQEFDKAKQFFEKAIDSKKPSKEALLSYAAFSENRSEFKSALALLEKHDNLFGGDLNSMVSCARIHDKIGLPVIATEKYKTILHAGFRIPPDLDTYIKQRIVSDN